jgi:hypothetical protein
MLAKSLHAPIITRDESEDGRTYAFSRVLTAEDRAHLNDVATTPCQFQPNIEKAYELRVTSVGTEHTAVRIDATGEAQEDWRANTGNCSYQPWTLPDKPAAALTRLMQALNINYAASDFIVTPNDEVIFLEANPHGAWLWLEEALPELGIAERFAKYLGGAALNRSGVEAIYGASNQQKA